MKSLQIKESYETNRQKPAETFNFLTNQSQCYGQNSTMLCGKKQVQGNNFNCTQKQWYLGLENNEFLSRCEQFIMEHSHTKLKQTKKKPVNFFKTKKQFQKIQQCERCKEYCNRQLQWMKQKLDLQNAINQLQQKLFSIQQIALIQKEHNKQKIRLLKLQKQSKKQKLSITNEVLTINIFEQLESYLTKSRTLSQQTMSTMQSEISPSQLITDKQIFLQSLKSYNQKLQQTQSQNKYLKIQNYTLMKTKTEIQTIKRQMQKTKSQRDMFKKKLIAINDKQHSSNNTRENNLHAKLKQRKIQNKNSQDLFQLSLTDSKSNGHLNNNNNTKSKKIQRPQFIQQKHK